MNKTLIKKLETAFNLADIKNVRVIVKQTPSAFESAKKYIGGNGFLLYMSPVVKRRKYGSHFAILSENVCNEKEAKAILMSAIAECLKALNKKDADINLEYGIVEDKQVVGVSAELNVNRENKLDFMMNIAADYFKSINEIKNRGNKNA